MDGSPSPLLGIDRIDRYPQGRLSMRLRRSRMAKLAGRYLGFLIFVVLPTLLAAIYYLGFAADQYQSEAKFVIYSSHGGGMQMGGLTQMLGIGAGSAPEQSETFSVIDYMKSHDAVTSLEKQMNLVQMFRDPKADPLSKLWSAHPRMERLVRYFDGMVNVQYDQDTGITTLSVHSFTPDDSYRIANTLLNLGEAEVNKYNDRMTADTVTVAQHEVNLATSRIEDVQNQITRFRVVHQDLDPELSGKADMTLIAQLDGQLAQTTAELAQLKNLSSDSPQVTTLKNRVAAIKSQIVAENSQLTGQSGALAPVLAKYQDLTTQLKFAQDAYTAAETALTTAQDDALKQQLFLVRVVSPNLPEISEFPRRWLIIGTIFGCLSLAYGVIWLLLAGVKEHAI